VEIILIIYFPDAEK